MAVLTVAELKKYLRYEASDTSNDAPLGLIVDAAQRYVENYTGHLLVQRQVVESPAAFPTTFFDLRWKPYVTDSLAIGYLDSDYAAATFEDFNVYAVNGAHRVAPASEWPGEFVGITFTYTAGYADLAAVPDDLLHALAVYAANYDMERGGLQDEAKLALDELLMAYRKPVVA